MLPPVASPKLNRILEIESDKSEDDWREIY
jgi:hypothetical protein